jgi:hypothetical protein
MAVSRSLTFDSAVIRVLLSLPNNLDILLSTAIGFSCS